MRQARYFWLFLSLVLVLISHVFRAARWNLLIGAMHYKTRLWSTFFALMTGYLVNTGVPRMGEFVRCGALSKKENIPFNALFGTVISERFVDLVVLVLLIFLVIIFQLQLMGDFLHTYFDPFVQKIFSNIWGIGITFFVLLLLSGALYRFLSKNKAHLGQKPFYQKMHLFLKGVLDGMKTIGKMERKGLFFFYTFMIWLFYALMVYYPVRMFAETSGLTFVDGLTLLAIGSLGIVAPVPGGIGAYHFIIKAVLVELYHINAQTAISFATLTHAGQTLLNISVGSIGYLILFLTRFQKPKNDKPRTA
jgi:uncharacterized protein (TIRG00374 family)